MSKDMAMNVIVLILNMNMVLRCDQFFFVFQLDASLKYVFNVFDLRVPSEYM